MTVVEARYLLVRLMYFSLTYFALSLASFRGKTSKYVNNANQSRSTSLGKKSCGYADC